MSANSYSASFKVVKILRAVMKGVCRCVDDHISSTKRNVAQGDRPTLNSHLPQESLETITVCDRWILDRPGQNEEADNSIGSGFHDWGPVP